MKRLTTLILLIIGLQSAAWGLSIYDIQFTTFPGSDNTYPSPYAERVVSTEGIVVAKNYQGGGYFISEAVAGPFSGILVMDRSSKIQVGDKIRLSATVKESFGMTTLQDVHDFRILQRNHPLPHPVILTTAQLGRSIEAEAYEGVYVKVLSVSSAKGKSSRNRFQVSDGTGLCGVQLGSFDKNDLSGANIGARFSAITGLVTFSFGEFVINPVQNNDLESGEPVSVQNRSWGRIKSIYK